MKVTFINKSDSQGGAAVVTLRLVQAMRSMGVDARLLTAHKTTGYDYVAQAAPSWRLKTAFLADRLPILLHNGMSRRTLFSIDAARAGLPLWRHRWVKEADAVALGWINQGILSLRGIKRLARMGKPLLWTMHDMWCMTGVCHHAHSCRGFEDICGNCPLLGRQAADGDLSRRVWERKNRLYTNADIQFVAVSNWLRSRCDASSLLGSEHIEVIPNAFPCTPLNELPTAPLTPTGHIIMVAARLDDAVKGLPLLVRATEHLRRLAPMTAEKLHFDLVGELRDKGATADFKLPYTLHGPVGDRTHLRRLYSKATAVVSPSLFETLPGTLIEGMDLGILPVAFDRGGQRDIIDHLRTGYLARWDDDADAASLALAEGILWAYEASRNTAIRCDLNGEVRRRFSAEAVAKRYIDLIKHLS